MLPYYSFDLSGISAVFPAIRVFPVNLGIINTKKILHQSMLPYYSFDLSGISAVFPATQKKFFTTIPWKTFSLQISFCITITENMNWGQHIPDASPKATKTLGFRRRDLAFAPTSYHPRDLG